ncbi:hypothetical protein RV02_GL003229 [Enterococcus gilvus]|nr:hypothetical protein RV02_GL003229 [Enterococcus gilvus]
MNLFSLHFLIIGKKILKNFFYKEKKSGISLAFETLFLTFF